MFKWISGGIFLAVTIIAASFYFYLCKTAAKEDLENTTKSQKGGEDM